MFSTWKKQATGTTSFGQKDFQQIRLITVISGVQRNIFADLQNEFHTKKLDKSIDWL